MWYHCNFHPCAPTIHLQGLDTRSQHLHSWSPRMSSSRSSLRPSSARIWNRSGGRVYEGSGSALGDKVCRQYRCECTNRTDSSSLRGLQAYALTWIELRTLRDCRSKVNFHFSSLHILGSNISPLCSHSHPRPHPNLHPVLARRVTIHQGANRRWGKW